MLNMTEVELELMTDITMVDFIESGIRGGVSFIQQKYEDTESSDTELHYWDANNLYGWCQSQPLPLSNYEWLDDDTLKVIDTQQIELMTQLTDIGFILEVDLIYDINLHSAHSDFPLCPQATSIAFPDMSPFTQAQFIKLHPTINPRSYNSSKLTPTLCDKANVVLHVRTLHLYLSLGLKLSKVHRVIKFTQSTFLEPYIELCTAKRQSSTHKWQKDVFKLFANSCFGKTIENPREFVDMKICNNPLQAVKHANNPRYHANKRISENIQIFTLKQPSIRITKPFAVGMSILDFAKLYMYNFWYNILKPAFITKQLTLHMHDTDSFIFSVKKGSFKVEMMKNDSAIKDLLDGSKLHPSHECYNTHRQNIPGYFKDELEGGTMLKFVGLQSKCYSFQFLNSKNCNDSKIVCKGVKKQCVEQFLDTPQYEETLFKQEPRSLMFHKFQKTKQQVAFIQQTKTALSPFDDKRYALCSVHSLPYGSALISSETHQCEYMQPQ